MSKQGTAQTTDSGKIVATSMPAMKLRRTCSCGEHTGGGEQCDGCKKKDMMLQRDAVAPSGPATAPPIVHDVLRSPGQPLESKTRAALETDFGHDFSGVRVHADPRAAASAQAVSARAWTVGSHIAFAPGQYQPHTPSGSHLLRHELAHTMQQAGSSAPSGGVATLEIGSASDPQEAEAERVASSGGAGSVEKTATTGQRANVVRRQTANPPTAANATPSATTATPAATPAAGTPAATATPAASGLREWAFGIELGKVTDYASGYGDAHLDRSALGTSPQRGSDAPPCELEIQLKLRFEFHLGASPHRNGPNSPMSEPGPSWEQGRAQQWKQAYMSRAQEMWRTRWTMEPANPCPGEPCMKANGHLRIIDVDTMTDAQGQQRRQLGDQTPNIPHVTMQVYEHRPAFGKDVSRVGGSTATLYAEDVEPQGTPQPQGFDTSQYTWRPGAAAHETGHMLGRPHISCPPGTQGYPNREECYGATGSSDIRNVMGRGQEFSKEDQAPFLAAMQAITGCQWKTSSGGLPGWAIALIAIGGAALVGGAIGLGVALSHH